MTLTTEPLRESVKAPRGYLVVGCAVAVPMRRASVLAFAGLLVLLLAAAVATLTWGRLGLDPADLPAALLGDAQGKDRFVFNRLRGPRLTVAIGVGAALGLSGALFQSVTRNPLGSPDVIGLSAGAGAGAAICALMFPGTVPVALGALIGAVAAMALVYVSTGTGFRNPARLVIAGIGVAAMGAALTQYVVYALERDKASVLTAYVNGSLTARSWSDATTIWLVLLAVAPLTALISRRLDIGEMGDDISEGLGAEPKKAKTLAVILAIALSAAAVSVSGPIAFIALTAPQIARRLTRGSGPHLLLSALTGALLLVAADLCAQQLPLFDDLPVGIYTMAIGGAYLGHLLIREWRRGVL
ncbi:MULTISPECIES: iron chelate uptake ABC transporter family permease subunit [Streptomyces]|uniref:FecCD family ABC transporter permease n=1 Tax=Streptomyces TaxID=1883 RepID=UPI00103F2CB5|nr:MULTISPECIES: iron chelate uptake ABC transporter family permease subunit [Streptomyces]MBT3072549.1 iron chelate uptake ABC transporter family permease subunit [Streptomyces sp. COG21]MBT3090293.1 iron chelate uptake ABC transporter family permease subunit [Streptomyces sp. CYG21]MBT3099964.1 iron chelate uptake ABC transporter family permease subunit [Streptomyces sp. CBG30]MBT3102543.1 iron chelate uptake ABC transporter family permease subunit [Streptomyces sp. COG19]MDI7791414.1 iron c